MCPVYFRTPCKHHDGYIVGGCSECADEFLARLREQEPQVVVVFDRAQVFERYPDLAKMVRRAAGPC
jgi:hypothetical protein